MFLNLIKWGLCRFLLILQSVMNYGVSTIQCRLTWCRGLDRFDADHNNDI